MYYPINEGLARQAQQANSFRDYVPGSATAEYRREVDGATALADRQKQRVSTYYHTRIDGLLESYCKRLADWYNDSNRNRASCPSVMISGAGNFPVGKKQKQIARDETLMHQRQDIDLILDKIQACGTGPVDLADPNARDILQEQIQKLQDQQTLEKKVNAWFRKHHTCIGCPDCSEETARKLQEGFEFISSRCAIHDVPFPAFELTSIRGKIKRAQERLQQLDQLQATPQEAIDFDGGSIVRNVDINRLQIFFDEKPDPGLRDNLKIHGFHWSPKQEAWQRQLTDNALAAAKYILGI